MITFLLILCAVAPLLVGLALRSVAARYEPVRSAGFGIFSVELRRRARVQEHPSGLGDPPFRQPAERRLRVFRIAGVPCWMQSRSVDLPLQVIGMIGTLTARDFDSEFDERFRLAGFGSLTPRWAARWFGRECRASRWQPERRCKAGPPRPALS
ncbi:MAG: hypothetical protein AD742_18155 [Methylibium sp. NZG]|nr:MAG: hypothetical protein AD742_18155 [Methylibium sp. NZG]